MKPIALVLIAVPLLLGNDGGCAHSKPRTVVVRASPAPLPEECYAPKVPAPALPDRDLLYEDADLVARDRKALKGALDQSEAFRSVCRSALEAQSRRG